MSTLPSSIRPRISRWSSESGLRLLTKMRRLERLESLRLLEVVAVHGTPVVLLAALINLNSTEVNRKIGNIGGDATGEEPGR
jgi:hypothetical protein